MTAPMRRPSGLRATQATIVDQEAAYLGLGFELLDEPGSVQTQPSGGSCAATSRPRPLTAQSGIAHLRHNPTGWWPDMPAEPGEGGRPRCR
jgi:hypothetical protein